MKIGIIGVGMVGGACKYGFEKLGHDVKVFDPKFPGTKLEDLLYTEIAYVCVPTDANEDGSCDTTIVEETLTNLSKLKYGGIVAIKSTVEPGFTDKMSHRFSSLTLCFVPEFLRERCNIADFTENHDLLAVGTDKTWVFNRVVRCHGKYPKNIVMLSPTEAELLKYYSNVFNALRVVFSNEMYELAGALGANYSKIKNAYMLRGLATDVYMDVNDNFRGYTGYCLIPESKVYTKQGLVPIKDIKIGDLVLTHTGQYRRVLNCFSRSIQEDIIKINIQGCPEPLYITKEHPILSQKNNRKVYIVNGRPKLSSIRKFTSNLSWNEASQLSKGDFMIFPLPKLKENNSITLGKAKLLGYYLAEGNLENGSNRVQFSFHSNETKFHNEVIGLLKKEFGTDSHIFIKENRCVIRASSREARDFFKSYGNEKSFNKKIPWGALIEFSRPILEAIIVGYFYGDGSRSGNRYTCATVSKELYEQLKYILFSLGIPFTAKIGGERKDKKGVHHKEAYYLTIASGRHMEKFSELLGDDFICKNPNSKCPTKVVNGSIHIPIKSIESVFYEGPVYDIEVEDDHSFVTYQGIVHNCLPKDVKAIMYLVKKLNLDLGLFDCIDKENQKFKPTVPLGMRMDREKK